MNPMMGESQQPEAAQEQPGASVTITKLPDGTFTVADQPAATLEEAMDMAKQMLGSGDGEMSPEQAFSDGFNDKPMKAMA